MDRITRARAAAARWWRAAWPDVLLLAAVTAVAAVPRLVEIGNIPPGLHGDEAIAGIEAREILRDGLGDPYTVRALGVPTGTFYWVAFIFKFTPDSVQALRFAYALIGIATVSATYLAFRAMFDRWVAVIGALILAVSVWHLHFSRLAFIPLGWPLFQMLALACFFAGVRTRVRWWFALAGASLGLGVYTYQAFVICIAGFAVICAVFLIYWRRDALRWIACVAIMAGTALLFALPMINYARDNPTVYEGRYRQQSVTKLPEYEEKNWPERAWFLFERERDYVERVVSKPRFDAVDGAGLYPFVDTLTLSLLVVGGGIVLWRLRRPEYLALVILALAVASGGALQIEGPYRRTLGVTPLLAGVAALPLATIAQQAWRRSLFWGAAALVMTAVILGTIAQVNLDRYFRTYDDHPQPYGLFFVEMRAVSEHFRDEPPDAYVYFYSERARFDFETRQFLAPGVRGEDRSEEFALVNFSIEPDRGRDVLYVLLGRYMDLLPTIVQRYPGGDARFFTGFGGKRLFVTYRLPALPGAAAWPCAAHYAWVAGVPPRDAPPEQRTCAPLPPPR